MKAIAESHAIASSWVAETCINPIHIPITMKSKTRIIFHTSAWLAYFRGDDRELEKLVESHEVLTPSICMLELASLLSEEGIGPVPPLRLVTSLHQVLDATPEIAVDAAAGSRSLSISERVVYAHAKDLGLPVCHGQQDEPVSVSVPKLAEMATSD